MRGSDEDAALEEVGIWRPRVAVEVLREELVTVRLVVGRVYHASVGVRPMERAKPLMTLRGLAGRSG